MRKDSLRQQGLRHQMVERLKKHSDLDPRVLDVMARLPRHYFVDTAFTEWVYSDRPFSIGSGQTISSPFTVAYQTTLLQVEARHKIMEVGTGSGYQAAVLAMLGARVYSLERHRSLYENAKQLLADLQLNVRCYYRDGFKGLPEHAPFDGILVTAGATEVPKALKEQLRIGGRLIIPVGKKETQQMMRITRLGQDRYREERFALFRFVPFLKGKV